MLPPALLARTTSLKPCAGCSTRLFCRAIFWILACALRPTSRVTTELARRIVELRAALRTRLEQGLSGLVVPFEPGAYNKEATSAKTCSSAPPPPELADRALAANPYFASVLKQTGLDRTLCEMGMEIAEQAIGCLPTCRRSPVLPATRLHERRGDTRLRSLATPEPSPQVGFRERPRHDRHLELCLYRAPAPLPAC